VDSFVGRVGDLARTPHERVVRQIVRWTCGLFANLVLADEINRAAPEAQSALLEALADWSGA
jgi:MoxR-like ATPase